MTTFVKRKFPVPQSNNNLNNNVDAKFDDYREQLTPFKRPENATIDDCGMIKQDENKNGQIPTSLHSPTKTACKTYVQLRNWTLIANQNIEEKVKFSLTTLSSPDN